MSGEQKLDPAVASVFTDALALSAFTLRVARDHTLFLREKIDAATFADRVGFEIERLDRVFPTPRP